jgi:phosphoribosylanthranilate isomerase
MALSRFVKVGSISNLSDARFCAGMGVEMLGFRTVEGQDHYIAPKAFQEIRGWISGPAVVAEVYGLRDGNTLATILENYRPDYLELGWDELPFVGHTDLPLILSVKPEEAVRLAGHVLQDRITHLLIPGFDGAAPVNTAVSILAGVSTTADVDQVLAHFPEYGLALNGSAEIRPGLKSFDELADVLERLDE